MNGTIATVLREYGQAFRGDWSSSTIDGRTVKYEMNEIADALENGSFRSLEDWRNELGLCPDGKGHWYCHCNEDCSEGGE